ncbi:MAG: hypothetical protein GXW99_11840 [Clostridiales bacterium]|nr:hypothetical protein [Clostridiales bacterium]
MKIHYAVLDPTKNITLLVKTPVERALQPRLAAALLQQEPEGEQVGFIEPSDTGRARLQMMGGEFCGNAAMSLAVLLCRRDGKAETDIPLEVSGADSLVNCHITWVDGCYLGTVDMPLPEKVEQVALPLGGKEIVFPSVVLPGIRHLVVPAGLLTSSEAENVIRVWGGSFSQEAVGLLLYDQAAGRIDPLVYVKSTDTAVWERGCGSGSAAVGALRAWQAGCNQCVTVRQPGGTIAVSCLLQGGVFTSLTITGTVKILHRKTVELTL